MGVMIPSYFSIESFIHFLEGNWPYIIERTDGKVRQGFIDLRNSIKEYQQQQEEKREKELLKKLKQKYEN